jgi:hypothetical protein
MNDIPFRDKLAAPGWRISFVVVAAAVMTGFLGACSGSDDAPTATATVPQSAPAQPAASAPSPAPTTGAQPATTAPAPEPTQVPTLGPVELEDVTVEYLSGMVLNQDSVDDELSDLAVSPRSGSLTADAVANHTVDPADTGETISSSGYIGGYENTFANPTAPFTVSVSSRTYLWEDEDSARGFIERQMEDAEKLRGTELQEGTSLLDAVEHERPGLGSDARSGLLTGYVDQLDQELTTKYRLWRRGAVDRQLVGPRLGVDPSQRRL